MTCVGHTHQKMGRHTGRQELKKSLKNTETRDQLSKYKRMGTNKLKRIKDPESFLRKAVLINNSIQFCNEKYPVKTESFIETNLSADAIIGDDSCLTPEMIIEIDKILNVFSSSFTDLECLDEIKKIPCIDKSEKVNISIDTHANDDPSNDIDNILSELELPPLLDPFESFEDFKNNFLESDAASNERFEPVQSLEDLILDITNCPDSDVVLDENYESFNSLNSNSTS